MAARHRILVAEDNEDLQRIVRRIAEQHGCEVFQTTKGREVLALAMKEKPDLIVLDVGFPDLDGRDVLARLKAEPSVAQIPVLVWSGRAEGESDRRIALELGAEDYVEKLDAEELVRKIERTLLRFK